MKYEMGRQKTGGRAAGTPNKRTSELAERLSECGVDPVQAIIDLLPQLSAKEQVDVYSDLLSYIYPKRKAVEISADTSARHEAQHPLSEEQLAKLITIARISGRSPNE